MEDDALSGMDRYEELKCAGEKPLTSLVVLLSEVPLMESDDVGCAEVEDAIVVSSTTCLCTAQVTFFRPREEGRRCRLGGASDPSFP